MVKVNFTQAGGNIPDEGVYLVTLEKATDKKSQTGKEGVLLQSIVSEVRDGPDSMEGRKIFTGFWFDPKADADNSTTIYFLQQALLSFGADEEDVTRDGVDPVKDVVMNEDGIKGNTAIVRVTHKPDNRNPEVMQAQYQYYPEDQFA